jgi:polyhydroxyalkanoate synthesis regulator phasin
MDKIFKRFLYTGVGLVSTAADHLQKQVNDVMEQVNQNEKEGERIVSDFIQDLKTQSDKLDGQWKEMVDKVLNRFDLSAIEKVEHLKERVETLTEQVEEVTSDS